MLYKKAVEHLNARDAYRFRARLMYGCKCVTPSIYGRFNILTQGSVLHSFEGDKTYVYSHKPFAIQYTFRGRVRTVESESNIGIREMNDVIDHTKLGSNYTVGPSRVLVSRIPYGAPVILSKEMLTR